MRSFTPARPIKRRALDVRKKRDPSRVSDAEIIVILQQWLGALNASGGKNIDGSLRRICASHAAAKAHPIKTRLVRGHPENWRWKNAPDGLNGTRYRRVFVQSEMCPSAVIILHI